MSARRVGLSGRCDVWYGARSDQRCKGRGKMRSIVALYGGDQIQVCLCDGHAGAFRGICTSQTNLIEHFPDLSK